MTPDTVTGTLATSLEDGGYYIIYEPDFVATKPVSSTSGNCSTERVTALTEGNTITITKNNIAVYTARTYNEGFLLETFTTGGEKVNFESREVYLPGPPEGIMEEGNRYLWYFKNTESPETFNADSEGRIVSTREWEGNHYFIYSGHIDTLPNSGGLKMAVEGYENKADEVWHRPIDDQVCHIYKITI